MKAKKLKIRLKVLDNILKEHAIDKKYLRGMKFYLAVVHLNYTISELASSTDLTEKYLESNLIKYGVECNHNPKLFGVLGFLAQAYDEVIKTQKTAA